MSLYTPSCALTLPHTDHWVLRGRSRAGDGTSWVIEPLQWMFDCGAAVVATKPPTALFLTHTHADHVQLLTRYALVDRSIPIYAPKSAVELLQAHLQAFQRLVGDETEPSYQLMGVEAGNVWDITAQGQRYRVTAVACDHRIDCLGYVIDRIHQRLRDDYRGLSSAEIGQLKREGVEITETTTTPMLVVLGDTTPRVFDRHPELLSYPTVLVECSFFKDDDVDRAADKTHMHWRDLQPIVDAHPATLFCLTHFSLKYAASRIVQVLTRNNVHPMMDQQEVEAEWKSLQRKGKVEANAPVPKCRCFGCRAIAERESGQAEGTSVAS